MDNKKNENMINLVAAYEQKVQMGEDYRYTEATPQGYVLQDGIEQKMLDERTELALKSLGLSSYEEFLNGSWDALPVGYLQKEIKPTKDYKTAMGDYTVSQEFFVSELPDIVYKHRVRETVIESTHPTYPVGSVQVFGNPYNMEINSFYDKDMGLPFSDVEEGFLSNSQSSREATIFDNLDTIAAIADGIENIADITEEKLDIARDALNRVETHWQDYRILQNAELLKMNEPEEIDVDKIRQYNQSAELPDDSKDTFDERIGFIESYFEELNAYTDDYSGMPSRAYMEQIAIHLDGFGDGATSEEVLYDRIDKINGDISNEYGHLFNVDEQARLFVDIDGTLAKFIPVDSIEELYEPGYFRKLEPIENVINAIKLHIKNHPNMEVYVLSSVLSDRPYAAKEKNEWLDEYLPEIDREHRLYPPCGESKTLMVPGGVTKRDFLLDDYSKNLHEWEKEGTAIKLKNGINGNKGTWVGSEVAYNTAPNTIQLGIRNVIEDVIREMNVTKDFSLDAKPIIKINPIPKTTMYVAQLDEQSQRNIKEAVTQYAKTFGNKEQKSIIDNVMSGKVTDLEDTFDIVQERLEYEKKTKTEKLKSKNSKRKNQLAR